MSHHNTECPFCHKVEQFAVFECQCEKARNFRADQEKIEISSATKAYKSLKQLGFPHVNSYNLNNHYDRKKLNEINDWVEGLIERYSPSYEF